MSFFDILDVSYFHEWLLCGTAAHLRPRCVAAPLTVSHRLLTRE